MRRLFPAIASLCLLLAAPSTSQAQGEKDWPQRPVHLVVPFPPGGASDTLARVLGEEFGRELGQSFIIDNKPGASASIASMFVAQAAPDGYTFMLSGLAPLVTNRFTQKKLGYDPDTLTRVGLVSASPNLLVTHAGMPFRTVPELVAYARANPGKLTFASYGLDTSSHLAGEMLKKAAGIDMLHVPYKGANEAIPALMGGQVSLYFDATPATVPLVRAGKVHVLGVTSARRIGALPDSPTIAEQGFPDYEMNPWNGIVGPPRLPVAIVARFNTVINKVMQDPQVRQKLATIGIEPLWGSPADFNARLLREIPRIQGLVKSAGIEPQ